jgi:tetratricopeptide (TPR) repeat protein
MNKLKYPIFFVFIALMSACSSDKEEQKEDAKSGTDHEVLNPEDIKPSVTELEERISQAEKSASERNNVQVKDELVAQYLDFVQYYPENEKSPRRLLDAANEAYQMGQSKMNSRPQPDPKLGVNEFQRSVDLYERFLNEYAKNKEYQLEALTQKAFIQDFLLEQDEAAIATYEKLISDYPDDPNVEGWKNRIENIDLSIEEMIMKANQH